MNIHLAEAPVWEDRTTVSVPITRWERQNNILVSLKELYARFAKLDEEQGTHLSSEDFSYNIVRKISVPTFAGRISLGPEEGEIIEKSAVLAIFPAKENKQIFMVKSAAHETFGIPFSFQSNFGCHDASQRKMYDGFAVELDPKNPDACVMYGMRGPDLEPLENLKEYSARQICPDPELFASICISACNKQLKRADGKNSGQ